MSNAQLEYGIWNMESRMKLLFINVYINSKFKSQKLKVKVKSQK